MAVLAVLLDRNAEHPAGAFTVDVPAFMKDLGTPLFMRKMAEHTGFDGAEVADDEFVTWSRDERGPDQFRQHTGDGVIQHVQHLIVASLHKIPRLPQILHVVLREILQLDQASGPAATAVGSVKLEHSVAASVSADRVLHRLVFADGALGELQSQGQHFREVLRRGFDHGGDVFLPEGVHLHAVLCEVALHLNNRARIREPCLFLHSVS